MWWEQMVERAPLTAAAAIRYCRERLGKSARALSRESKLSESYVYRVEAEMIDPSLRSFARIAVALGMTDREIGIVIANEAAVLPQRRTRALTLLHQVADEVAGAGS